MHARKGVRRFIFFAASLIEYLSILTEQYEAGLKSVHYLLVLLYLLFVFLVVTVRVRARA